MDLKLNTIQTSYVCCIKKIITIMRLTIILFMITIFCASAEVSYSQVNNISLNLENVTLEEALEQIKQKGDYSLWYRNDEINLNKKVSLRVENKEISQILDNLLANEGLGYIIEDRHIIVYKKEGRLGGALQQATKRITGTVTDEYGEPIIGANVVEKGTTNGGVTDIDGNYSLSVSENSILQFSYIGYTTQEITVGSSNIINAKLETSSLAIDEVVVTALGLQREKKSLGYAVQEVGGNEVAKGKELDVVSALAGRVSGVHITQGGGGLGGSSRIVIRGENSISGGNTPLYIIDGVPGSSNEVASDDIESISILKGPAASALYGSRALSGVVVISTKSGKGSKELTVDVNSSTMFQNPLVLPKYQFDYGQGSGGIYLQGSDQGWGPKLAAGEGHPNNAKDFYETGHILTNNVAISKGTDNGNYRLSYTNMTQKGIVPNTDLQTNHFDLSTSWELIKDLKVNANVKFNKSNSDNNQTIDPRRWPVSLDLKDLRDYWITEGEEQKIWKTDNDNPYFSLYENTNPREVERWFTNISANYKFLKHFSAMGRMSYITESGNQEWFVRKGSAGFDEGREREKGGYSTEIWRNKEINADFLLSYENYFLNEDLFFKISAGGNHMNQSRDNKINGKNYMLGDVDVYTLANYGTYPYMISKYGPGKIVNSLYAFANLSYQNKVFMDVTARNDWSSTLPSNNNSYFYPSVSLSFLMTEIFSLPEPISFWKLRGSFASVGNDTDPGLLQPDYKFTEGSGGIAGITEGNVKREYNLKPEIATSFEVGTDIRFFKNRLSLDLNYYKTDTRNQIWNVQVSNISGYEYAMKNAGKVSSQGLEVSLKAIPVQTRDFTWNTEVNWSMDRSKIIELDPENPDLTYTVKFAEGMYTYDKVGERRGALYSRYAKKFEYDPAIHSADLAAYNGAILHDPGKKIQRSDDLAVLGNYNPDWIGSWYNSFQYKDFNLSFLLFCNYGNSFFAGFEKAFYRFGLAPETGTARNNGGVLPTNELWQVVANDPSSIRPFGAGDEIDAETYYKEHIGDGENNDNWIRNGSFLKLKELTFTYNLPKQLLSKTFIKNASVSFVGRNLFVWSKVKYVDPEGYSTENNTSVSGSSLESAAIPSTRNLGFSVNIQF